MDKEMEVELLNVIKYTTNDNRNRTILKFIVLDNDAILNNDKFKGITIVDSYYDGFDVFNKIPIDLFGKKCTITLRTTSSPSNPLVQVLKITRINDISLV